MSTSAGPDIVVSDPDQPDCVPFSIPGGFDDFLSAFLFPRLYEVSPRDAISASIVCKRWRAAALGATSLTLKSKLWDERDMWSLGSWLQHGARVVSLDLSTAQADIGDPGEKDALQHIADSLPRSCTSLKLSGSMAIPYVLLRATQLMPELRRLHFENLPAKFNYKPGMFPWPEGEKWHHTALERESSSRLQSDGMNFTAVQARYSTYWGPFQVAVDALMGAHAQQLEDLYLESPAPCVSTHVLCSLAAGPASNLHTLKLSCFRGKYQEEELTGLDISCLPSLAPTLKHLELLRCSCKPCSAITLEALSNLQTLSLPGTRLHLDRLPDLCALTELTQLTLRFGEIVCPDESDSDEGTESAWELPASLQALNLSGFSCVSTIGLKHLTQLTSLADLESVDLSPNPPECRRPYTSLHSLTCLGSMLSMIWSEGSFSDAKEESEGWAETEMSAVSGSVVPEVSLMPRLWSLELMEYSPKGACKFAAQLSALTLLVFSGEMVEEGELELDNLDDEEVRSSFCPPPGSFPMLLELHLNVGALGYDALCLHHLTSLTQLCVDSVEYVNLREVSLPSSLVKLELSAFYGLHDLYLVHVPTSQMVTEAALLEKEVEDLLIKLVSGLPLLEVFRTNWDLVSMGVVPYLSPSWREVHMRWCKNLTTTQLLDMEAHALAWESITVADGKKKYIRAAHGQYVEKMERGENEACVGT